MGFRTVVVVANDYLEEVKDPVLKQLILDWWGAGKNCRGFMTGPYRVVEQVHCDHDTLMHVQHLDAKRLATAYWNQPEGQLDMLRKAADRLGYKLIKKSQPK